MKKIPMKIHPDFDLHFQLRKIATDQTLRYIEKNMNDCLCFSHTIDVLFDYALPKISTDGLILAVDTFFRKFL